MLTRVVFYDQIKNWLMPYDVTKYQGFDYFWRAATASVLCSALTLFTSYPLDLIHTRTSADMSRKNMPRLYTTTFDCFNRTNLDETRLGLFKGAEIAVFASLARSVLQLPVYSMVKHVQPADDSYLAQF